MVLKNRSQSASVKSNFAPSWLYVLPWPHSERGGNDITINEIVVNRVIFATSEAAYMFSVYVFEEKQGKI